MKGIKKLPMGAQVLPSTGPVPKQPSTRLTSTAAGPLKARAEGFSTVGHYTDAQASREPGYTARPTRKRY